jgi:hypothetical protein
MAHSHIKKLSWNKRGVEPPGRKSKKESFAVVHPKYEPKMTATPTWPNPFAGVVGSWKAENDRTKYATARLKKFGAPGGSGLRCW